jgi:pimeloyl-ACP methyl ester carboxylesterase
MRAEVAGIGLVLLASACAPHAPVERVSEPGDPSPPLAVLDGGNASSTSEAGDASDAGDTGKAADVTGGGDAGAPAPLGGYPEQLELVDGDDKLGVVSVPLGAREPRPLVIALHGGSDTAERACAAWREITEAYAFVVCPRGWGGNDRRLGWKNAADTSRRITRALEAAKKTFGAWIEETPTIVLAGFSMGAVQVALVARRQPQTYRRIVIGDSAHKPRSALTFAAAWAKGGGERALFLCTTSGCEPSMRAAAKKVAREKAKARLNIAPTQKHGLSEPVVQSVRRDWPWLVEGADGWEGYVAPSEELPGKTEPYEAE